MALFFYIYQYCCIQYIVNKKWSSKILQFGGKVMKKNVENKIVEIQKKNMEEAVKLIKSPGMLVRMSKFGYVMGESFSITRKRNLKLELNIGGGSHTDGVNVVVGLPEIFFGRTVEECLIAVKALIVHEYGHIRVSDFSCIKEIVLWAENYFLVNHGVKGAGGFAKNLLNAVEDGRMERLQATEFPGTKRYLEILNKTIHEETAPHNDKIRDYLFNVAFLSLGLEMKGFSELYQQDEIVDACEKSKPFIKKCVDSDSPRECMQHTIEMISENDIFIASIIKNAQEERKSSGERGKSGNSEESKSEGLEMIEDESVEYTTSPNQSENQSNGKKKARPILEPDDENEKNKEKNTENEKEEEEKEEEKKEEKDKDTNLTAEEWEDLKEDVENEIQQILRLTDRIEKNEEAKKEQDEKDKPSDSEIKKVGQKFGMTFSFDEIEVSKAVASLPHEIKMKGKQLNRELKRIFADRISSSKTGKRNGILESSSLWRLGLGDKDLFTKRGVPDDSQYVAYLLVDESGSMSSSVDGIKRKIDYAVEASMLLEEGLRDVMPLKITRFNVSNRGVVVHKAVKRWTDKGKENHAACQDRVPNSANADALSIAIAAGELSKRKEQKKILFVLSDGLPAYGSQHSPLEDQVNMAVKEARGNGILVIPIRFGTENFLNESAEIYKKMYERDIISCAPAEIPKELVKILKQVIKKY